MRCNREWFSRKGGNGKERKKGFGINRKSGTWGKNKNEKSELKVQW